REKDERDCDERELEWREADVPQMPDTNEVSVGDPALSPERGIGEHGREDDVRNELWNSRVRDDRAEVERRDARTRGDEGEGVGAERDAEPYEPRPRCEVGERDRTDAVEARESDDPEAEPGIPNKERRRHAGGVRARVESGQEPERETRRPLGQHHIGDGPGHDEADHTDRGRGREAHESASMRESLKAERPGDQAMGTLPTGWPRGHRPIARVRGAGSQIRIGMLSTRVPAGCTCCRSNEAIVTARPRP